MTTTTERCLTCNGEGHYWTRERNAERIDHRCDACNGTGVIVLPDEAPEPPLPVTTTTAEPAPPAESPAAVPVE